MLYKSPVINVKMIDPLPKISETMPMPSSSHRKGDVGKKNTHTQRNTTYQNKCMRIIKIILTYDITISWRYVAKVHTHLTYRNNINEVLIERRRERESRQNSKRRNKKKEKRKIVRQ